MVFNCLTIGVEQLFSVIYHNVFQLWAIKKNVIEKIENSEESSVTSESETINEVTIL